MLVKFIDAKLSLKRKNTMGAVMTLEKPLSSMDIDPTDWTDFKPFCHSDSLKWESVRKDILNIYTVEGIGDLHWVFMKLEGLKKLAGANKVILHRRTPPKAADYYKRGSRSDEFIKMNPTVNGFLKDDRIIEIPGSGCITNALGYDYILNPCPVLESGKRIEEWMPSVPINYNYAMDWPLPMKFENKELASVSGNPIIYFGSRYAEVTWAGNWTDDDWASVTKVIEAEYGTPVAIGLDDDLEKARGIEARGGKFINLIGKTNFVEAYSLISGSKVFVAAVGGLSIVMASRGYSVVELWPDHKSLQPLSKEMRNSWLLNDSNHCGLGYSSSVSEVLEAIERVVRT